MPNLIIIRGAPGSGKTTYAAKKYPTYRCFAADDFFYTNGVYNFSQRLLKEAHEDCFKKTKSALLNKEDVVVTNTFVTLNDLEPYLDLSHIAEIDVICLKALYGSIHNVPLSKIEEMYLNMEKYSKERTFYGKVPKMFHILTKPQNDGNLTQKQEEMWLSLDEQKSVTDILHSKMLKTLKLQDNLNYIAHIMNTYMAPFRDELGVVRILKTKIKKEENVSNLYIGNEKLELSLCKHNGDNTIILDLKEDIFPLTGFHQHVIVEYAIRLSLKLHPRNYLFCSIIHITKPMGYIAYGELMQNLYKDVLNKDWSIVLARLSFLSSVGKRRNISVTNRQAMACLMRSTWYNILRYSSIQTKADKLSHTRIKGMML